MRLKSSLFVSALLRRVASDGGFGVVLNKGAEDAGAIFIVIRKSANTVSLYGPAPQTHFDDETTGQRAFECLERETDQIAVSQRIESQLKFDPDCWVVEFETRLPANELLLLAD